MSLLLILLDPFLGLFTTVIISSASVISFPFPHPASILTSQTEEKLFTQLFLYDHCFIPLFILVTLLWFCFLFCNNSFEITVLKLPKIVKYGYIIDFYIITLFRLSGR